mgnify:CR=1 FL=1|tara:strand:+ start:137 stop:526 length:390 start_codon:yes stop_codon:yes gene_type:complete
MTKITSIDRATCTKLRESLNEKLSNILKEELGITLDFGNASFDSDSVTFKCRIAIEGARSENDKSLEFIKPYMSHIDFDKEARIGKYLFKIVGYRNKARTKPWLCRNEFDGKNYVLPQSDIDAHFRKAS